MDSKSGIVAGHERLLAARKLNLKKVPVIVLDHLSDPQRRAYILADSRLAEQAGWDRDLLSKEFESLADDDFDLTLTSVSDDDSIDEGLEPEEEIPPPPKVAVTQQGDVWHIGPHGLICGVCRDPDVVARLLAGAKVNVVFRSPPYATQREYDSTTGFRPVPASKYVPWFQTVAENIASTLAQTVPTFSISSSTP